MGGYRLQCLPVERKIVPSKFGVRKTVVYAGKERVVWELPLSLETMKIAFNNQLIDLPFIPKDEILDKNGRDALSKVIAITQLTWFILQIAARVRQNLAVTELELTTAALASLNIAMYISWWSKPTDILCPTRITTKKLQREIRRWMRDVTLTPTPHATGNADNVSKLSTILLPDSEQGFEPLARSESPITDVTISYNISKVEPLVDEVSLVKYFWGEFVKILGEMFTFPWEAVKKLHVKIPGFWKRVGNIASSFASLFRTKADTSRWDRVKRLCNTIAKLLRTIWNTFAHLFLALIYYPILAIIGSGKGIFPCDLTLIYYPILATIRDGKGILMVSPSEKTNTPEHLNTGSQGIADTSKGGAEPKHQITSESCKSIAQSLKDMSTVKLMFNKAALRFVMEMVFFCEDVASAPFSCLSAFSGAIFGMIHCLAWNFEFPSPVEQILWRISSSIISGLCIFITIAALGYIIYKSLNHQDKPKGGRDGNVRNSANGDQSHSFNITEVVCSILAMCFVLTRISLITLSFMGLRALPASAFDAIQWSGFIPHI